VAVVIDVLRATSTATQALAGGYERVRCAETIERARALCAPGRLLAGEQRCLRPTGFDLGNSPRSVRRREASELVLGTTNGTPAIITAAYRVPTVMLGCLLNLRALTAAVSRRPHDSVQLVCAGSGGRIALEDVYVAGRMCAALRLPGTDSARIAEAVARSYPTPFQALNATAHAQALRDAGLATDIAYCSRESVLDVIPVVQAAGDGVAVVARDELAGAREQLDDAVAARTTVGRIDEADALRQSPVAAASP
jgi:2-phosphosulfolactate phosphatase